MLNRGLHIRNAEVKDLQAIKEVDQLLFQADAYPMFVLRQLFDITGELTKVALVESKVAGYAIGHYNAEKAEAWFLSLGVLPAYRGQRIGEGLMLALIEEVQARGAAVIQLTVHPANTAARKLYERLGFKVHKRVEDYYFDAIPRMLMRKEAG
ncbi:MAG: GNAT family N-acetyltransferase [Hymenobacteraceae bacterium]|nr:GNAT family N-acetyltransferase [Hymenobacteraceae bacterium]